MKFLDAHDNDPALGMAMEEAVDAGLLSEEEAKEIFGRGADGLLWNEMLLDATRNHKLQEFLKGNRWLQRQGFTDFDAKSKEAMQQEEKKHKLHLMALAKEIADLEEEVPTKLTVLFCSDLKQALIPVLQHKKAAEAPIARQFLASSPSPMDSAAHAAHKQKLQQQKQRIAERREAERKKVNVVAGVYHYWLQSLSR